MSPENFPMPGRFADPLTAQELYNQLGALLRMHPEAGSKPVIILADGRAGDSWGIGISDDGEHICLDSDVPAALEE